MNPPPIPSTEARTFIVRPHRAQTLLILACIAFLFAPCGLAALLMARRDLRAMADGSMDRSGEPLTKLSRTLAIVAGIVWAVKWVLLCVIVVLLYLLLDW